MTPEDKSTTQLVTDLFERSSELMRKEVQLLRAEMNEKSTQVVTALGMVVGGVIVALTALNVLAAAVVEGLEELGLDAGWAALIVGLGFAAVAFLLIQSGVSNLKASSLAPARTAASLRKDADTLKETTR